MNDHKKIERLMLFVEVAQQLNFTRAAVSLGISKGYLSGQIKKLETELRCPLLIRTTRSVRLTREGERLLVEGLSIRSQLNQLERNILDEHSSVSGLLRMTAPKMFAERYLFDLCKQFTAEHPDIRFEINCSYTTFDLNLSDIDIGFRATTNPPEDMVASEITRYQHLTVAAPAYLAVHGTPTTLQELSQHNCMATLNQRQWPFRTGEVNTTGWMVTNENQILKQRALAGEGIIRIASYYVSKELEEGTLVQVLASEVAETCNKIYLFYPQLVYPSTKIKTFVQFIKKAFDNEHTQ